MKAPRRPIKKPMMAGLVVIVIVLAILPVREIYSFAEFSLYPARAKSSHLVRLENPASKLEVVLLGSAHYLHIDSESYPLWELKSAIETLSSDAVFVEIRPESINNGNWGEGPVEMPFCAFVAKDLGLDVKGMDDWSQSMETREGRMVQNILEQSRNYHKILVVTGYSHLPGLTDRLLTQGFVEVEWPRSEREKLFKSGPEKSFPAGLREAYLREFRQVDLGDSDFNEAWVSRRQKLVDQIDKTGKLQQY
jgi:hypothetical protein